jgi:hypothetical protein
MFEGEVFITDNVGNMAEKYPQRVKSKVLSAIPATTVTAIPEKDSRVSVDEDASLYSSSQDAGAAVFLFPPPGRTSWSLPRLLLACKLWFLERLAPAYDSGVREKVTQLSQVTLHDECLKLMYLPCFSG